MWLCEVASIVGFEFFSCMFSNVVLKNKPVVLLNLSENSDTLSLELLRIKSCALSFKNIDLLGICFAVIILFRFCRPKKQFCTIKLALDISHDPPEMEINLIFIVTGSVCSSHVRNVKLNSENHGNFSYENSKLTLRVPNSKISEISCCCSMPQVKFILCTSFATANYPNPFSLTLPKFCKCSTI